MSLEAARCTTTYRCILPADQTEWKFDGNTETCFTWEYDEPREALLQLYAKGKKQQWDAAERIDWSQDLDPENPMMLDDRVVHIFGTALWDRMTDKERSRVRHHLQASQILAIHARRAGGAYRDCQDLAQCPTSTRSSMLRPR